MAENSVNKDIPRILIVDDVEANRFALKEIVADMGCLPILIENGMQALKMVQHVRPQLMILDIAMPEMDGYEICQKMKENPETRGIPIIFISAFDNPEDIVKGFSLGGEDYITKPFIKEVVKARINMHLRLYEASSNIMQMNNQLQVFINEKVKQIEKERRSVLYALLRVARENACYDDEFMERVRYNCRILAEAMQLSEKYADVISDSYIDMIELTAPLCDLGNMAIHTSILQKQGLLDEEQTAIMRTHTVIGARILKDIGAIGSDNGFIQMAIEIANYHHENWDGSGYPAGKKEDEIPLSAQIVAVISSYCALTENRTYRKAYIQKIALEIMEQESGKKFNPDIFWIMKKIVRQLH
ncbi:MAG: response regulator [Lachnospiraceae bacterium]|nr:response regulator [Lachnospiraceae bacterium]